MPWQKKVFQNSQAPFKTDISSTANASSCFAQWTGASSLSRDSCQIRMLLHEEKAAQTGADTVAPQPPHTWTHGWKQKCPLTLPLVTGKVGNRALLQDWYFVNLSRRVLLRETHVLFHLGSFVLKKKTNHSYHVLQWAWLWFDTQALGHQVDILSSLSMQTSVNTVNYLSVVLWRLRARGPGRFRNGQYHSDNSAVHGALSSILRGQKPERARCSLEPDYRWSWAT